MAGQTLAQVHFIDMLPDSIRQDAQVIAAADTLDVFLHLGRVEMGNVLIWSRIDGMEEPLLSNLAYQLHLEGYEGWQMAESVEHKRRLVKDAIKLHFYKGTCYTLKRLFELIDMRGVLTEWWEAPDDPDFHPYEFDIDVDISRPIDEDFYGRTLNLIAALKNLRSHLRRARFFLTSRGKSPYIGGSTLQAQSYTVYPYHTVGGIEPLPAVAHFGGTLITDSTFHAYPLEN
ncbi:MAG: phage tail protein I [Planctomycetaceae bacterium]|nr:phage tail protein I [Planctomycetaceae bacterium]